MATESEIICEHKCVINVLIFQRAEVLPPGELTCIKLAIVRAQKNAHILKVSESDHFLPIYCLNY